MTVGHPSFRFHKKTAATVARKKAPLPFLTLLFVEAGTTSICQLLDFACCWSFKTKLWVLWTHNDAEKVVVSTNAVGHLTKMPELKTNLRVLVEQFRIAHTEERLRSGWCHLFGPHFDSAGAQELHSREEMFFPAVMDPDLPAEVEEEGHLEEMDAACDVESQACHKQKNTGSTIAQIGARSDGRFQRRSENGSKKPKLQKRSGSGKEVLSRTFSLKVNGTSVISA